MTQTVLDCGLETETRNKKFIKNDHRPSVVTPTTVAAAVLLLNVWYWTVLYCIVLYLLKDFAHDEKGLHAPAAGGLVH